MLNVVVLKNLFYLGSLHTADVEKEQGTNLPTTIFMQIFYHVNEMKYGQESWYRLQKSITFRYIKEVEEV